MALDGIVIANIRQELEQTLLGGRLYKIAQPETDELLFTIKTPKQQYRLVISANASLPLIYLSEENKPSPMTAPNFCMLLRKHLEEGRITKISQSGLDRIITLEIDLLGASSKIITKKLIFELTGKNSNIILTQDDVIIDSLKHVSAAQSSYRTILPGKAYIAPPPQEGLNLLTDDPAKIVQTANSLPAANFAKAFISATTGVGKMTTLELLAAADILPQEVRLESSTCQSLAQVIGKLQADMQMQAAKHPVHALISRTNQVKTLLVLSPQNVQEGMQVKEFTDINSALNFAVSLKPIQLPRHEQLQKLVNSETAKLKKKLQALQEDLAHAANAEEQRMLADTIMANIYQIKKGQTSAELINIYDGEPVTVSLSPILSPTENAQAYYKRYNKYKRAQTEVRIQQESTEEMLAYLESLDASLLTATTKEEIEEINQEMLGSGLLKDTNKKKKNAGLQKSQPLHIRLNPEADLYIGKNNKQNDYVTFTLGNPKDLWFHTKDIPGSHVILKTSLPEARQEDIDLAVQLAAYFSKARDGSNVPVDCVQRRYVKKPAGSKPGFVVFTNQNTYYTTPDMELIQKYLK